MTERKTHSVRSEILRRKLDVAGGSIASLLENIKKGYFEVNKKMGFGELLREPELDFPSTPEDLSPLRLASILEEEEIEELMVGIGNMFGVDLNMYKKVAIGSYEPKERPGARVYILRTKYDLLDIEVVDHNNDNLRNTYRIIRKK